MHMHYFKGTFFITSPLIFRNLNETWRYPQCTLAYQVSLKEKKPLSFINKMGEFRIFIVVSPNSLGHNHIMHSNNNCIKILLKQHLHAKDHSFLGVKHDFLSLTPNFLLLPPGVPSVYFALKNVLLWQAGTQKWLFSIIYMLNTLLHQWSMPHHTPPHHTQDVFYI